MGSAHRFGTKRASPGPTARRRPRRLAMPVRLAAISPCGSVVLCLDAAHRAHVGSSRALCRRDHRCRRRSLWLLLPGLLAFACFAIADCRCRRMPLHPDPTDLQKCSSCARKPKEGLPQPDGNILEARGMGESSKPARAARRRAGAWLVPGRALLFGQAPPVFFERVRCGGSVSNACADGLAHVLIAPRVSRAGRALF